MKGLSPQKRFHLAGELRIHRHHVISPIDLRYLKQRSFFERKLIQKLLRQKNAVTIADFADLEFHNRIIT